MLQLYALTHTWMFCPASLFVLYNVNIYVLAQHNAVYRVCRHTSIHQPKQSLMSRYHNREAVVISALQVEKHPLTTPGPFATPPPPGRHATLLAAAANAFGISASTTTMQTTVMMTPPLGGGRFASVVSDAVSRSGSPVPWRPGSSCASVGTSNNMNGTLYGSPRVGESYRSSPKPHSSPKMKLRLKTEQSTISESGKKTIFLVNLYVLCVCSNLDSCTQNLFRL